MRRDLAVCARIRQARQELRLTLDAVASQVGITKQALGKIERGETAPRLDTLLRIAQALGVRAGQLLDAEPVANSPAHLRRRASALLGAMGEEDLARAVAVLQSLGKHAKR